MTNRFRRHWGEGGSQAPYAAATYDKLFIPFSIEFPAIFHTCDGKIQRRYTWRRRSASSPVLGEQEETEFRRVLKNMIAAIVATVVMEGAPTDAPASFGSDKRLIQTLFDGIWRCGTGFPLHS